MKTVRTDEKKIYFKNSLVTNNRNKYTFYVRAEFDGGGKAYSNMMTYQVVCGSETISIEPKAERPGL